MSQQQQPYNGAAAASSIHDNDNDNDNKNAWMTQGRISGWDRVAAHASMKEGQKKPGVAVTVRSSADTNKNKNTNSTAKNKNNNSLPMANNNSNKHKTMKPAFSVVTKNNNSDIHSKSNVKKKQKRSEKEPEPLPKTTHHPPKKILLKATDFPALQQAPSVVIRSLSKPTTKLDASSPVFVLPQTAAVPITPSHKNNNDTNQVAAPSNTTKNVHPPVVKPKAASSSSGPKQTKAPTPPSQKQKAFPTTLTPKKNIITATPPQDLPQGQEHALLRLMQQGKIMVVTPKGRQRIRPRKKKFSGLKKKVLEERLRQWRARNDNSNIRNDKADGTAATSTTLAVLGWLTADDDWNDDDEDEYHELCSNFQEMAEKIGNVQRTWVPRHNKNGPPVFVQFQTPQTAEEALHAWNGLCLGGSTLQVMALSLSKNDDNDDNDDDDDQTAMSSSEEEAWQQSCEQAFQEKQASSMKVIDTAHEIGLWNALTDDDLEDDECLEESMKDIRVLATSYGPLDTLRVEREGTPFIVLVYTCNLQDAKRIVLQLNQVTLSGIQLSAKVLRDKKSSLSGSDFIVVLRNVLTAEDLEDEECLDESLGDIKELAEQFGVVERVDANVETQTISVQYTSEEAKTRALTGFQGMIIGGRTVSVTTDFGSEHAAMESGNNDGTVEPMFSGDKRIPERFAECKRVPKIANSGEPRHYATISKNETVKPLLTEMLAELMRLQKRAVEDKNAKAKRRLVMGLREVARGIRAHKVRMVVMANNLDEYGALDEKLQEILDLAQREEVPVFFEFSKRALGKAIGKTIKIAVIGIQNPDGANQQFKKLSGLATPISTHAP